MRVVVKLEDPGVRVSYRGHRSRSLRDITINRLWSVTVDGQLAGTVSYEFITRERKTRGRRYVNARWQSPGWRFNSTGNSFGSVEYPSKQACIDALVTRHAPNKNLERA